MMNFSSCCMSQNVFISPLFLKDFHWVKDSRLKVFFFSFQCFKEGAPHLLVCIVSDKKKNLPSCFYIWNVSFFLWLKIFFMTSFKEFDYVWPGTFLYVSCTWVCWASWIYGFKVFIKFGKFSSIISNIFCFLPSCFLEFLVTVIFVCLKLSYSSLMFYSFFSFSFPFVIHFGWFLLLSLQVHCFFLQHLIFH